MAYMGLFTRTSMFVLFYLFQAIAALSQTNFEPLIQLALLGPYPMRSSGLPPQLILVHEAPRDHRYEAQYEPEQTRAQLQASPSSSRVPRCHQLHAR